MTEHGLGIRKNAAQAKNWYEKAAQQGIGEAQYSLANLYLSGKGTTQNLGMASEWMQKAAEQGMTESQRTFFYPFRQPNGEFRYRQNPVLASAIGAKRWGKSENPSGKNQEQKLMPSGLAVL